MTDLEIEALVLRAVTALERLADANVRANEQAAERYPTLMELERALLADLRQRAASVPLPGDIATARRDAFAASALQSVAGPGRPEWRALEAYALADAMLKARDRDDSEEEP